MKTPFISVIIPTFNDHARLKICLRALENQTYDASSYEVLVIDNSVQSNIAVWVKEFAHAQIFHEKRKSSYAARNLGIARSRGEILVFTDSDCIPATNWLEKGVAQLQNASQEMSQNGARECGFIGGGIEVFACDERHPTSVESYEMLMEFRQSEYVKRHNFGVTANLFTWRRVLDDVGFFDATLQSGGDRQWGKRVVAAGYRAVYANDTRVRHPARRTWRELRTKAVRVAGGFYQTDRAAQKYSLRLFLGDVKRMQIPSNVSCVLREHEARMSGTQKFKFLFVAQAVQFVRQKCLIRLSFADYFRLRRR